MIPDMPQVRLKRTRRLLGGHLWVFSNELADGPREYAPGSLVELYDMRQRFLGVGYINPRSLIAVRLLTREREAINGDFLKGRMEAALNLRNRVCPDAEAVRVIYSEGDGLPGLIVDRYADCLVIQMLTFGIENMKDLIVEVLDGLLKPRTIVLRNDSRIRSLEGLEPYRGVLKGTLDPLPVFSEDAVLFEVDPLEGQKTGFFLDQRNNRTALSRLISGGRGLDLFCYNGGWSMHLASRGALVTGVDESGKAVLQATRNAGLNRVEERATFVRDEVFSFLEREVRTGGRSYDFIVLDPPAFVKSGARIKEALRAYGELNAACMRLLRPGGVLASSSCSYHLSRELFMDMLRAAGRDAGRVLRLLRFGSQGPDHPVLLSMPETDYLKCAFLTVD